MREIKFNFIYGIDGEEETYFNKTFSFGEIENGLHVEELCDNPLYYNYSILAKRQFIGLKDKNGKEIFEGDVLKAIDPNGDEMEDIIVEWSNLHGGYMFDYEFGDYDLTSINAGISQGFTFEVIDNIHENKE